MEHIQLPSQLPINPIAPLQINTDAIPPEYDNEFVKLMADLSRNKSMSDIINYINSVHWSRRQKKTLVAYCRVLLGRGLSTTNVRNDRDYRMLLDDKDLIGCDLSVGLTRFDLTPEWNILLGMINLQFGLYARMSKGGWFVEGINKQKHEITHEERLRERAPGFKDAIGEKLGFGGSQ